MNPDLESETRLRTLPLDDTLLELHPKEEAFFKSETGIQDTEELRKHILGIQEDAYKVSRCSRTDQVNSTRGSNIVFRAQTYPYPCIRGFGFTKIGIARTPAYPSVLGLAKNRPGAIFLDMGCCCKDRFVLRVCLDN